MRACLALLTLLAAGCDSPDPRMAGAEVHKIRIENSSFSVHVRGSDAVAIRTNFEAGKAARGIMGRGYRAIEQASGCQIVPGTFDGDPALMRARLACASPA